jgi:AraC-like DNA-binding protein
MNSVLEKTAIEAVRPKRRIPRGPLARYIAEIFAFVREPGSREHVGLPQGHADIVFRVFNDDGRRLCGGDLHAVGAQPSAFRVPVADISATVVVRFHPGAAYMFLGVPMRELTDRVFPLDALWGAAGQELYERLMEAPGVDHWLELIEHALEARLTLIECEPPVAQVASAAARAMSGSPAIPSIKAVAEQIGVSERQLRRQFHEAIGLGPKTFARILRFERAMHAAREVAAPHWAELAVDAGYYDQAHFIAEAHDLAGMTPPVFLRLWKPAVVAAT